MRDIFKPVFKLAGWFSPYLKAPAWFHRSFLGAEGTSFDFIANEEPDTAAFDLTTIVSLDFAATEVPDTAAFDLTTTIVINFSATEVPDTAAFDLTTIVVLDFSATEAADTADFEVEVVPEEGTLFVDFIANEAPDTALFEIFITSPISVPIPPKRFGLGPFLQRPERQIIEFEFAANEAPDIALFRIEVLEELPAPPLAPASLPEFSIPPKVELSTGEVPLPVVAVLASFSALEKADGIKADVDVTDWIAYDNEALLMLVRTE